MDKQIFFHGNVQLANGHMLWLSPKIVNFWRRKGTSLKYEAEFHLQSIDAIRCSLAAL